MKRSILIPAVVLMNLSCNREIKHDCGLLKHSFKLNSEGISINLPSFKISDSTAYTGFDKTVIASYHLDNKDQLEDSFRLFISVHNYKYQETLDRLNFSYLQKRNKREMEYLLNEKNILIDTTLSIDTIRIGYLKYLIDPKTTNYADKSGTIHYDSKIFFFKEGNAVEIEIIEKYRDRMMNRQSLTDCILKSIKFTEN